MRSVVFDGLAKEYEGTIVEEGPSSVVIKIQNIFSSKRESPWRVTLGPKPAQGGEDGLPDPEGHGTGDQRDHPFFLLPFCTPLEKSRKTETPSSLGKNCHRGFKTMWKGSRSQELNPSKTILRCSEAASPDSLRLILWEREGSKLKEVLGRIRRKRRRSSLLSDRKED